MTKHCRDESNGCAAARCTCKCSVCDPRSRFAKFMDWLTNEPPEAELPEDLREDVSTLPPVHVAVQMPDEELHIIPLAKVHPEKVKKLHAVLAKKPKKGKRK